MRGYRWCMDSWEARMAARARQREADKLATARAEADRRVAERTGAALADRAWLNGWPSDLTHVYMGTGVHCVCCGRCVGVVCVAFEPGWEPPGPEPAWPFCEADCPMCAAVTSL